MSRVPSRYAGPLLLASVLWGLASGGCAHVPPRDDPAFRTADPRSILIVPVVNRSIDVAAADLLLTTLPIPVAERGYYVFPVELVKRVLEDEGCADADVVHRAEPSRVAGLFGADAVLYVAIEKWVIQSTPLSIGAVVEIDYILRDARTGRTLWTGHARRAEIRGADPMSAAMAAALLRVLPPGALFVPMAKQANETAFANPRTGLPPGPYHPDYPAPRTQERSRGAGG